MSTSRRRASLFHALESPYYLLERQRNPSGCNTGRKAIDFSENKCWIPPVLQSKKHPIQDSLGSYIFHAFYGTLFMESEGTGGKTETMLNRVFSFILFFSIVLFSGNWGGFWGYLPLLNCGDRTKRLWALSSIYLFLW